MSWDLGFCPRYSIGSNLSWLRLNERGRDEINHIPLSIPFYSPKRLHWKLFFNKPTSVEWTLSCTQVHYTHVTHFGNIPNIKHVWFYAAKKFIFFISSSWNPGPSVLFCFLKTASLLGTVKAVLITDMVSYRPLWLFLQKAHGRFSH